MHDFWISIYTAAFSIFDVEQVCFNVQVINVKNKEVTTNPKHQTLEKNW